KMRRCFRRWDVVLLSAAEQALDRQERSLALLVALAEARPAAALQGAASVGALLVDGAEVARARGIDGQGGAVPVREAHVAAVADELGERSRLVVHPVPVVAEDADVLGQRREAARPAGRALRRFGVD